MYFEEIHFTPCIGCRLVGKEIKAANGSTLELTEHGGLIHHGLVEIALDDGGTEQAPSYNYISSGSIEDGCPELADTIKGCGRIGLFKHCPARQLLESMNPDEQFPWPSSEVSG